MLEKLNPATIEYYEAIRTLSPEELTHEWQEIELDQYWYLMECVPPKAMKGATFLVGECVTHHEKGAIYEAVTSIITDDEARYFSRPALFQTFNSEAYTAEIRAQFGI
jgi:Protein of unknown function (DUF1419)